MVKQMQKMLQKCERCIWHQGAQAKAPLHLDIATSPRDLLHIDYMSIEMMMELNKPPKVVNMLIFQDHFIKNIMAYVTPIWTAKIVAKYLHQGYILVFGALAKLLSDQGANFKSNIT